MSKLKKVFAIGIGISFLLGAVGIILGFVLGGRLWPKSSFLINNAARSVTTHENIQDMEIEVPLGSVKIVEADIDYVRITATGPISPKVNTLEEMGKLSIRIENTFSSNLSHIFQIGIFEERDNQGEILIEIPPNKIKSLSANVQAGEIEVSNLSVDNLSLSTDAGNIIGENIYAKTGTLAVDAGVIEIDGLINKTQIDVNLGSVEYNVADSEAAFDYKLQADIGTIQYGDMDYEGTSVNMESIKGLDKRIDATVDAGEVIIEFNE